MLQETRDKGRKIKTDRGELDIYCPCFTSEEAEARSGQVAYRVILLSWGENLQFLSVLLALTMLEGLQKKV